jgi:hypothetical protein
VFATYPVAPPRLVPLGLIDTVTDYSHAYRVLQPAAFVNQYAAMPSLHVGWDLLIGIALFTYSTHLVIRAIGVLLPALMAFSVLATANHFLLDAVVGVSLVLVCLAGARRWERRRAARRRARGRPAERIPVVPRAHQLPVVPAQVVPAEAAPAEAAPAGAPPEEGRGDVVPQPRTGGSETPAALSCSPGERCDD